jgi:hypothetical protein
MSARSKLHKARGREFEQLREVDPDGRIVVHHRTVDSLAKLSRTGAITEQMHDAGRAFQRDFQFGGLDPIRTRPLMSPVRGGVPEFTEDQLDARQRVHAALKAAGGIGSPGASCLWHVLGCGCSVREWAIHQGWNGRPIRQEMAAGVLVAALGMLAAHVGYGEARRAS